MQKLSLALFSFLIAAPALAFSDISADDPHAMAVDFLRETGVVGGYADGSFRPDGSITRAELVKILVEGQGVQPAAADYGDCFPDVTDEWFAPYVCYAAEAGWVRGYDDGDFKPDRTVSKVEALKMIINSSGMDPAAAPDISLFTDTDAGAWYAPFLRLAKAKGLIEETDGVFLPGEKMTRGKAAENMYRAIVVKETGEDSFAPEVAKNRDEEIRSAFEARRTRLQQNLTKIDSATAETRAELRALETQMREERELGIKSEITDRVEEKRAELAAARADKLDEIGLSAPLAKKFEDEWMQENYAGFWRMRPRPEAVSAKLRELEAEIDHIFRSPGARGEFLDEIDRMKTWLKAHGSAALLDDEPTDRLALVDGVTISLDDGFPVEGRAEITGVFSDGCGQLSSRDVSFDADAKKFTITLRAVQLAEECTQQVQPFSVEVELPLAGVEAGTYSVEVNSQVSAKFTLDEDNVVR